MSALVTLAAARSRAPVIRDSPNQCRLVTDSGEKLPDEDCRGDAGPPHCVGSLRFQ
jgi:hypothetical protein